MASNNDKTSMYEHIHILWHYVHACLWSTDHLCAVLQLITTQRIKNYVEKWTVLFVIYEKIIMQWPWHTQVIITSRRGKREEDRNGIFLLWAHTAIYMRSAMWFKMHLILLSNRSLSERIAFCSLLSYSFSFCIFLLLSDVVCIHMIYSRGERLIRIIFVEGFGNNAVKERRFARIVESTIADEICNEQTNLWLQFVSTLCCS